MTKQGITVSVALILIVLIGAAYLIYKYEITPEVPEQNILVTNFEECASAGYPVMESYPRQCRVPDGELFVEPIASPEPTPVATGGCFVGGCSGQICSDQKDVASTCEFKQEYACYKTATCERQTTGKCGWTQTGMLAACISTSLNNN